LGSFEYFAFTNSAFLKSFIISSIDSALAVTSPIINGFSKKMFFLHHL